ncbi:MAG: NAD-dependent epimerase/dehydratase family protein [Planctomycetes bacterium]|nr:NAD-dependent epimerase/dehydratase family protein [Planctomycetota bacterium]
MNLVTGGAGFIGSHLVRQLVDGGESVRVLERPTAEAGHLPLDRVELIRGDIRDAAAMRNATRGCEFVYHLAADPNLWRQDRSEFDAVNHVGALNVLRAALENGARRVLYVSTESILSTAKSNGGAVESARFKEEDMIGPYCLSKFRAELAAFRLAEGGAPVIVCSPTLPIGPGDHNQTPPTRLAVAFCRGQLPAYLDCRMNLIDVRDAADGLVRAMQRGRPGVRYLLGGHNVRLIQWLEVLGRIVQRRPPRLQVPYPLALSVGWLSEQWADLVTHSMPMATVAGVRLTRRSMHFDPSASLRELGLTPRGVEESTLDAVHWYRQQHWI